MHPLNKKSESLRRSKCGLPPIGRIQLSCSSKKTKSYEFGPRSNDIYVSSPQVDNETLLGKALAKRRIYSEVNETFPEFFDSFQSTLSFRFRQQVEYSLKTTRWKHVPTFLELRSQRKTSIRSNLLRKVDFYKKRTKREKSVLQRHRLGSSSAARSNEESQLVVSDMSSFKQKYSSTIAPGSNSRIDSFFSPALSRKANSTDTSEVKEHNPKETLVRISESDESQKQEIEATLGLLGELGEETDSVTWTLAEKPPSRTSLVSFRPKQYLYVDSLRDFLDTKIENSLQVVSEIEGEIARRSETAYLRQKISRLFEGGSYRRAR